MRRYNLIFGAVCATAALTLCACGTGDNAGAAPPPSYTDVQNILQRLTTTDGAPGVLLEVNDGHGRTVLTSGVANIGTQAPMVGDSRFRIGSMTKMFVSTAVLQLVAEHRVALDAPVEQYLPGVVRGNGNDGQVITVRQLLQHTSGVPDYLASLSQEEILKNTLVHHDPLELVQLALGNPSLFPPGTGWSYSNTNYLLAGMIIEKVTGRPYGMEIGQRIIGPLGLRDTSVPGDESSIPGVHPQGYAKPGDAGPIDLSEFNPSIAGAAGSMVSSAADLNQFLGALMNGRLLNPPELQAMMTTRPTGDSFNDAYGLGFQSTPLPCGGLYWGHDGGILGFETLGATTTDGRTATMMVNLDPGQSAAQDADIRAALATALCASSPSKPKP
ncbi:serine hydrolase domain-containing protein [Nocardia sp. NPDC050175]|uniref:serine hydrolase domain-containing protein n=1 Tax=Nocardia sp. NPDC050175 TaxID=3364317 RepID=UPI00378C203F